MCLSLLLFAILVCCKDVSRRDCQGCLLSGDFCFGATYPVDLCTGAVGHVESGARLTQFRVYMFDCCP